MKKFLAVFDGFDMSESTLNYGIQLSRMAGAQLVGVFLDDPTYRSYRVVKVIETYGDHERKIKELDAGDKLKREEAAHKFQQACDKAGIRFSIHRDQGFALDDLKRESTFADLVIISQMETFTTYKSKSPTRFIKDLLADVQCPVLIVPAKYKPTDKVVLLYDGCPSSLYAIKLFSYLFCDLFDLPVEVLTVKQPPGATTRLPENTLMREFIKRHFPKATYTVIKGDPEQQIVGHLRSRPENELVVLGAYRRSDISRWFKESMADILMQELAIPLFVAHNK